MSSSGRPSADKIYDDPVDRMHGTSFSLGGNSSVLVAHDGGDATGGELSFTKEQCWGVCADGPTGENIADSQSCLSKGNA